MTIEEIKTEWQRIDKQLETSRRLNEQLIQTMLRERSRSRVAQIRRNNAFYMGAMVLNLLLLAAIFVGNPFDFKYTLQYVPYAILAVGVLLAIVSLVRSFQMFTVDINTRSIEGFLTKILSEYDKNKKIEKWFGFSIISAGLLTAFSFLLKKLEHKALWQALAETGLSILITGAIYFIAFKSGAFKNRNKEGFESDLKEWQALKNIAEDLSC